MRRLVLSTLPMNQMVLLLENINILYLFVCFILKHNKDYIMLNSNETLIKELNEISDYLQQLQTAGPAQATLPPELTNYFQQHQVSAQTQETQLTEL